jgi:hypothetical protein
VGGAILLQDDSSTTGLVENCLIAGTRTEHGGGIYRAASRRSPGARWSTPSTTWRRPGGRGAHRLRARVLCNNRAQGTDLHAVLRRSTHSSDVQGRASVIGLGFGDVVWGPEVITSIRSSTATGR